MLLFHGTNRPFDAFDAAAARSDLNAVSWEPGSPTVACTFFSTDIEAAREYASSRRNSLVDREDALEAVGGRLSGHPRLARLFRDLVLKGQDGAWDRFMVDCPGGSMAADPDCVRASDEGYDLNDLNDLACHVRGSASAREEDGLEALSAMLTGSGGGLPDWVLDVALSYGLDCRPRVVAAHVPDELVQRTADRPGLERALEDGFAAAWMPGDATTVRGAPEVAVADLSILRMVGTTVAELDCEDLAEAAGSDRNLRHALLPCAAALDVGAAIADMDATSLVPANGLETPRETSLLVSFNPAGRLVGFREIKLRPDGTCRSKPLPCPDFRLSPAAAYVPAR